jgi:DNA repair protein RadC
MKQPTTAAEQVATYGSKSVSDKQLLECIGIPAPAAEELMVRAENTLANIAKMGIPEIVTIKGISKSRAAAIVAAIELGRRRQSESAINRGFISSSLDMYDILHPHMRDLNEERFFVVFLDRRSKLIKLECIHVGGMASMIVDPKIVFRKALENKACSIILSHNHPSGAPSPSVEDIRLTEKLKMAGQFLDIKVLDHIIIGDGSYYSFADEGKM